MSRIRAGSLLAAVLVCTLAMAPAARALVVTPTSNLSTLLSALVNGGTGLTIVGASLDYRSSGSALSVGTFTNNRIDIYGGIARGIVLSTGNAADYSAGPNNRMNNTTDFGATATSAQEALLDPITGGTFTHYDVTQLDIQFKTSTGAVFFYVVFGSEEYPEYVGSSFNDGFGMYLNGTNIAFVGGLPVNISHPDVKPIPGTELDGVLAPNNNPVLKFGQSGLDPNQVHTLTFILADASDSMLDTTVYIGFLGATEQSPVIPEPGTWLLMVSGLAPVAWRLRRWA